MFTKHAPEQSINGQISTTEISGCCGKDDQLSGLGSLLEDGRTKVWPVVWLVGLQCLSLPPCASFVSQASPTHPPTFGPLLHSGEKIQAAAVDWGD